MEKITDGLATIIGVGVTPSTMTPQRFDRCSTNSCRRGVCNAAQDSFLRENSLVREQRRPGSWMPVEVVGLTKGILCDKSPPCVLNMLFKHEFRRLKEPRLGRTSLPGAWQSRCRGWKHDHDWPTRCAAAVSPPCHVSVV